MNTLHAWGRVLAPRLLYRLRTGQWCDHETYRYRDWVDEVDDATGAIVGGAPAPSVGWGEWELADLGRMKIRFCQRCGHMESTNERTVDLLTHWWQARDRRTQRAIRLCLIAGAFSGVVIFSLAVTYWPLLVIMGGLAFVWLVSVIRGWPE